MGLDMYLEGKKFIWTDWENPKNNPTEDGFEVKERVLRLGYWRKHPNLHGFIVNTFADGKDECQDIELDQDALRGIMGAVREKKLPHTTGFFFGASEGSDAEIAEDLDILGRALTWLETPEKGVSKTVVYRASW